jgi:hypothetical protein
MRRFRLPTRVRRTAHLDIKFWHGEAMTQREDREWLSDEIEAVRRGRPNLPRNGRIAARPLDGVHFGLLVNAHADESPRLHLVDEPLTPEELDG